ncbi:MAG: MBL fold metallo-hydrolase [Chloroflexi bacterium]|nr:MBL fold metallo-hydrolase [Chloroflexota bacterium]
MTAELWWLGQSGFRVRDPDSGATIFLDPFLTPSDHRSWQAPAGPADLAQADIVLASHEHTDHLDLPTLKAAAAESGSRFTLVVPEPLVDRVVSETGLPNTRVLGTQPGATIDRPGVRIDPVPARHGVNVSDSYNFGEQLSNGLVRYLGYVVEIGGVRLYHAGDCIPYDGQIDRLGELQPRIALLPINGRDFYRETERNLVGNMDPREAARIANDIGASVLIPIHWELFDHNRGFPRDLVAFVAERYPELSVLIFGRGARHTFVAQQ